MKNVFRGIQNALLLVSLAFGAAGAMAGNTAPDASTLATEAAIQAGVTQFNDPLVGFMPISTAGDPWMNSGNTSTYITGSNVHPNIVGSYFLAWCQARSGISVLSRLIGVPN